MGQTQFSQTSLEGLLNQIYQLRTRTYKLLDYDEPTVPLPPASESQIKIVENTYNVALPNSYRTFLSLHNGWEHWSGDVALLSTEQMLTGTYADRIRNWKVENTGQQNFPESSLVIGFSLFVGEQILLDFAELEEAEVVIWDNREIERHHSFFDYLLSFKETLEKELSIDLT